MQHLAAGLEQNLALGWPVYRIEYNSRGAKVFGPAGQLPIAQNMPAYQAAIPADFPAFRYSVDAGGKTMVRHSTALPLT